VSSALAARAHVRDLTPDLLVERFADIGLEPRHARRVLRRSVVHDDFELGAIEGLSRVKARALDEGLRRDRLEIVERRASAVDPFVKYLFRSPDGRTFEAVRIPLLQPRWSACISSQAGCAMGCAFCMTGRLGFERNLEPWEMVDQVLAIRRDSPERPLWGVVFQGQGEPFCNYENVMRAADVLRHPCGAAIRGDRMTISTVGILPMIERFAEERHPYRLILSLTSAFSEKRARLVPVGQHYDVADLASAMRRVARPSGGVIHLAWVLMAGENTQPEEAREIRRLFPHDRLRVCVIDVNDPTGRFTRAGDDERKTFLGALAEQGISFVRRYSGGPDIHAACGMLASQRQGGRELPVLALPGA
jgi:23S rRNA (adenine2503-C2)-methyltransferase